MKVESASAFQSAIVQQGRFLPGLHGLRGAAALAVVLFHLVTVGRISTPVTFDFIGRDFGYSVHLFFILSAFSLCISTEPNVGGQNGCRFILLSASSELLRSFIS